MSGISLGDSIVLRLVNRYEELVHHEIKLRADKWGLSVYPKVRVADVIDLQDVVGELKRFGLQAHFDFVVCRDQWEPEYAVEFDGRYHSTHVQMTRDQKKDALCARAGFPLLRVNSNYLSRYGSMSLLAWLVDVYELQRCFDEHQARGAIPLDESFDPFFLTGFQPNEERYPYWLSAKARIELQRLHKRGIIADRTSSGFIGYDSREVMRGIEYIRVSDKAGLCVQTAMRPQPFPLCMSDLLDEILTLQLTDLVHSWIAGRVSPAPLSNIYVQVEKMRTSLRLARAHGYTAT